jgi:hypothetical protein
MVRQLGKEAPGMNRRTLLLLSTLVGGLFPLRLLAQGPKRIPTRSRAQQDLDDPPRTARGGDDEPINDDTVAAAPSHNELPPNLPSEVGHKWQVFDISKYTGLPHKENNPQNSLVDWIFRRTTTAPWHGEKVAVLAAGRTKIKAYHNSKVLDQVSEVIERFTDAMDDYLKLRVRFVAAGDTRWRYAVYSKLNPIGSGPQGQQIWSLDSDQAQFVLTQMQVWQGFRLLAEKQFEMINGQTLFLNTSSPRAYTGGMQRDSAVGQGFQPKTEELEEGVTLRLSPLLSYDGDTLDAAIELTANTVRSFHQTRVIAPREAGPGELRIDVPEVSQTRLNQTVKGWPLGKTMLISAGIQPGILQSKGGLFNMKIPGTVPTNTELLVFVDVEMAGDGAGRKGSSKNKR